MSDIAINLHFSTLACVWMDSVRRCPVYVSLVTSTRCDYQNCIQTFSGLSGEGKISSPVPNGKNRRNSFTYKERK